MTVAKLASASPSNPAVVNDVAAPRSKNAFANFLEDWLVMPKLLYFGLNVVIYATHAFLPQYVYDKDGWGLKKADFAFTNAVQFTGLAGGVLFSRLADRTGKYRLIVASCVAAYCASLCLLMFPPSTENYTLKLAYYLAINGVAFFFTSGTFPLLDSMVMSKLAANPKLSKELFGRQRLWGTIGHCVIGAIVHKLGKLTGANLQVMFYTLIVSSILFVALVFVAIPSDLKVEAHSHGHHGHGAKKPAESPVANVPRHSSLYLLKNPSFSFFLLTVFIAGIVRAVITTFQSPYITEELYYDKKVVSDSIMMRAVPEVTLYFFSKEISQWCGIYWVLLFGHVAGVVRMFGYTLVPAGVKPAEGEELPIPSGLAYASILALEWLKGANSSFVISSAARIASDMAPKGMSSVAQGLVASAWQSVAMTIGALVGRFMADAIDIKGTFTYCSLAGGVCVVLIFLKLALVDRVILAPKRKSVA